MVGHALACRNTGGLMRILKMVLLTTACLLVLAAPAGAQTYPGDANLTCNPPTAEVGETITMVATGYQPGSEVTFTINDVFVGTAIADADGVATLVTVVPEGTPIGTVPCGSGGIDIEGNTLVLSSTLQIIAGSAVITPVTPVTPAAPLPVTGSDSKPLVQVAVAIVALGGLMLLVSRKKSTETAKADTTV
jgi:LPXTG-motif cell wall-anchored protein